MTEKMYDKVVEKHKSSVFEILKIGKAFRHVDFNSTIRKEIHLVVHILADHPN